MTYLHVMYNFEECKINVVSAACSDCYGGYDYIGQQHQQQPGYHSHHHHSGYPPVPYPGGYCGCGGPCPVCVSPCQACTMITMSAQYQPRPLTRPSTLPGIQSLHHGHPAGQVRGHHDSPHHVHMHPNPDSLGYLGQHQHQTGSSCFIYVLCFLYVCFFSCRYRTPPTLPDLL